MPCFTISLSGDLHKNFNVFMEPKFFVSPHKAQPSVYDLPFPLSFKSSLLQKPKSCSHSSVSFSSNNLKKTPFLGQTLLFRQYKASPSNSSARLPATISGPAKRRKELPFDNVIQRDKKLKLVLKIRKILMSQPDRVMALRELGRFRKALGLRKRRRFIALLKHFPAVFEIVEEGVYSLKFKLTPEAERLYLDEMKIRNEMEGLLVVKLRKLLMMSIDKRIPLEKITHLKTDLGLPMEFRNTICHRYPQYFRVVPTGRGLALELTHWDPDLAVSAAELAEEENRQRELDERDFIIDRTPKFNRVKLPKGLSLSRGEMRTIEQFNDMPYVSPYSDFSGLRAGTAVKEKHACGVVHEMLSLTLEKRTLVDHLTHFREEFRFSQQLRGMLIRHPDMFYVSLKGDRDSVFLREAYRHSQLIEKNPMLLVKEKFRALVNVPRVVRPRGQVDKEKTREGEREDGSGEDEWSDIEDLWSDGGGDEDEWSDDGDDDLPPDFSDERCDVLSGLEVGRSGDGVNGSRKNEEKMVSVPRERW